MLTNLPEFCKKLNFFFSLFCNTVFIFERDEKYIVVPREIYPCRTHMYVVSINSKLIYRNYYIY